MTIADPYPAELAELDGPAITANPDAVLNRAITAINRLAQAIEQDTLARLHPVGQPPLGAMHVPAPQPVQNAPGAALTALPPVQTTPQNTADVCPIHNAPWKTVPAGV